MSFSHQLDSTAFWMNRAKDLELDVYKLTQMVHDMTLELAKSASPWHSHPEHCELFKEVIVRDVGGECHVAVRKFHKDREMFECSQSGKRIRNIIKWMDIPE